MIGVLCGPHQVFPLGQRDGKRRSKGVAGRCGINGFHLLGGDVSHVAGVMRLLRAALRVARNDIGSGHKTSVVAELENNGFHALVEEALRRVLGGLDVRHLTLNQRLGLAINILRSCIRTTSEKLNILVFYANLENLLLSRGTNFPKSLHNAAYLPDNTLKSAMPRLSKYFNEYTDLNPRLLKIHSK